MADHLHAFDDDDRCWCGYQPWYERRAGGVIYHRSRRCPYIVENYEQCPNPARYEVNPGSLTLVCEVHRAVLAAERMQEALG